MTQDDLVEHARSRVSEAEVVDIARRLVRINTENPPGHTREACALVAEELEPAGFTVEFFEPEKGFVNLVATHEFTSDGPTLILNGHVDVVPVGATFDQWTHDPWAGDVEERKLYGRGSLDMKGPLAGLLVAARSVVQAALPLRGKLVVLAVADEEQGGERGSGALIRTGKVQGDGVLIAEPGDGGIVIAHRGLCFVELVTEGKAAHASIPTDGINAVEAMVETLRACRTLKLNHKRHPVLGTTSIAVGTTIVGGEKVNVIPDQCRATLDIRTVPGMTKSGVLEDIAKHFRVCKLPEHQRPHINVSVWGDPAETSASAKIVKAAAKAYTHEFGGRPQFKGMPASTDARWFTAVGIPAVMGLAPGSVKGCHVVDEFVDVEALVRYTRVYTDTLVRFLGR